MPRQSFNGEPHFVPIGPAQGVGGKYKEPRVERCPPRALNLQCQMILGTTQQILGKRKSSLERKFKFLSSQTRGVEVPSDACQVPTPTQDDVQIKGSTSIQDSPTGLNICLQPSSQMQSILKGSCVLELGLNRWGARVSGKSFLAP
jgi:hypothetical protein